MSVQGAGGYSPADAAAAAKASGDRGSWLLETMAHNNEKKLMRDMPTQSRQAELSQAHSDFKKSLAATFPDSRAV